MPYQQLIANISHISDIGRNSVISIISKYNYTGAVRYPNNTRNKKCLFDKIDNFDRNALHQKIRSFWLRNE